MQTQYYCLSHIVFLYTFLSIIGLIVLSFIVTSKTFKSIMRQITYYNVTKRRNKRRLKLRSK